MAKKTKKTKTSSSQITTLRKDYNAAKALYHKIGRQLGKATGTF